MQDPGHNRPKLAYHRSRNVPEPPVHHPPDPRAAFPGLKVLAAALLLGLVACSPRAPSAPTPPPASVEAQQREFTGTWSVSGSRQTLDMGPGHRAEIFRLGGSLMLAGDRRPVMAFRSDIIGLRDTRNGMQGRSVWTDQRGDQVFSELRGTGVAGQPVEGRFVGGTGRYAGISGAYTFSLHSLVESEDASVSARVADLKGWARLAAPATVPNPAGTHP